MKTNATKLGLLAFLVLLFNCKQEQFPSIYLNQIGFTPKAVKQAFVSGDVNTNEFNLLNPVSNEIVYTGELSDLKEWSFSGTSVRIADFSDFQESGKYTLEIGNTKKEIIIDNTINSDIGLAALKTYYLARASEPILDKHAGIYARTLGHPDTEIKIHASAASASKPEGTVISSPGGWYDAGDYNKYIVNSGVTMHTLLQLYELYPDYWTNLKLDIPESHNTIPDLLDEILINLRWMLTMQDEEDGGVYHKLTSLSFCGMVQPHEDNLERYVVAKSTAAALDFAAVTSKSYRILSKFEEELPGLADSCLIAAKKAWEWTEKNPDVLYLQPKDISTGAYDDTNIEDEKYWAANELYLSTKDENYLNNISYTSVYEAPHWSKVGALGSFSWFGKENDIENEFEKDKFKVIKQKLIKSANRYYRTYSKSAFKTSIDSFAWGSNSDVANHGVLFIHAYKATGEKKYLDAAESNLNYLLGGNPLDMCFVTGFGVNSPKHVHDRRCSSDTIPEPIPGLLVGGPNKQARADCGEENYLSSYPALSYLDMECSYATNEIAINWNAPLAFLIHSIEAEKSK